MQRMTCATVLETLRRIAPFYDELARLDVIGAELINGEMAIRFEPNRMSPPGRRYLAENEPLTPRDLIKHWLETRVIVDGPKVFQPTLDQCLAMEQVAPRIAIADYAQPYPVMIVDLPEAYQKRHVCPFQAAAPSGGTHAPTCIMIGPYGQPPWTIWLNILFDSGIGLQLSLLPTDPTIEDGIVREYGADSYTCVGPFTSEERITVASLLRLAVNAMLLLVDFGCKRLGPANEPYYRRLEHYLALARKKQRGVVEAQRNLHLATQLYGFAQDIVLHEEERTRPDDSPRGGEPEAQRRPHWRHGHWKMQACGPGLREHKRVYIKPVIVNRHLLREGEKIPQTTYRVRSP